MQERIRQSALGWQKELVFLGVVIACEVLISDYLSLISTSEIIQPFCRLITQTHWKDELAHASIFKHIAAKLFREFDNEKQEFLLDMIVESSEWFCDVELSTSEKYLT